MTENAPSVEGLFCGFWAAHYVIRVPKVLQSESAGYTLEGDDVLIPRERVVFVQRLR